MEALTTRIFLLVLLIGGCSRSHDAAPAVDVVKTAPSASAAAPAPAPPAANCTTSRGETMGSECWSEGASCAGHGSPAPDPKAKGTVVSAGSTHGGCNQTTFALVYAPHTSPLEIRVCATSSPPMDCPAMMNDYAKWDVAPLLGANGATAIKIIDK